MEFKYMKLTWCLDRADCYIDVHIIYHKNEEKDTIKFKASICYLKGVYKGYVIERKTYKHMKLSDFKRLVPIKE